MFQTKVVEEIKTYVQYFFFRKSWKNMVESERSEKTIEYDACTLLGGHLRVQTHTRNI